MDYLRWSKSMVTTQKSKAGLVGYIVMVIRTTFSLMLAPFRLAVLFLVTTCLTPSAKRIITLTSLYYLLFSDDSQEVEESIHRINETFHFVNNEKALELPIALRQILWDEEDVKSILNGTEASTLSAMSEAQLRSASERIAAVIPKCIRYGRRDDMLGDIFSILNVGRLKKVHL